VSLALRTAFFLGNLPVALSSSIVMLENGMSRMTIFLMWLLLTGTPLLLLLVGHAPPHTQSHTQATPLHYELI
jgi:hypothetical protein